MDIREAKEIIRTLNTHKSIKDINLECIGRLASAIYVFSSDMMPRDAKVAEIAHVLVDMQRMIDLYNCEAEVKNASEAILESYRGWAGEKTVHMDGSGKR